MKREIWLKNLEKIGNTLNTNELGELEGSRLFFDRAKRVIINSVEERNELFKHNKLTIELLKSSHSLTLKE